jgi:hypothetical protein
MAIKVAEATVVVTVVGAAGLAVMIKAVAEHYSQEHAMRKSLREENLSWVHYQHGRLQPASDGGLVYIARDPGVFLVKPAALSNDYECDLDELRTHGHP